MASLKEGRAPPPFLASKQVNKWASRGARRAAGFSGALLPQHARLGAAKQKRPGSKPRAVGHPKTVYFFLGRLLVPRQGRSSWMAKGDFLGMAALDALQCVRRPSLDHKRPSPGGRDTRHGKKAHNFLLFGKKLFGRCKVTGWSWQLRSRRAPPCAGACPARTPRRRAGGGRGQDRTGQDSPFAPKTFYPQNLPKTF
jgi:hypothetical protein